MVPHGASFADIGTDHARLPIFLLQRGVIAHAIAADLRPGPLDRARHNVGHYDLSKQVSFRLCDGLASIRPGEADTIAIAGMGGETIASILEASPWTSQAEGLKLLLQPMSAIPELRLSLQSHGFRICQELLCREGETIYTIIQTEPGEMPALTPAELWAGRECDAQDSPLRRELLNLLFQRAEKALAGIRLSTKPSDSIRRTELEEIVQGLSNMKRK